jgi:hypothetical protein
MTAIQPAQIEQAIERAFARERFSHALFESMQRANKKRRAVDSLNPLLWGGTINHTEYRRRLLLAMMTPAERKQYLKNELAILSGK